MVVELGTTGAEAPSLRYLKVSTGQEESDTNTNDNHQNHWMTSSFPFFAPKRSLFMSDPTKFQGINCRFGMKGTATNDIIL